jgi:hypothetical protein
MEPDDVNIPDFRAGNFEFVPKPAKRVEASAPGTRTYS